MGAIKLVPVPNAQPLLPSSEIVPGLGKGSQPYLGTSETIKLFMTLRSCLAGAAIVAINPSWPWKEGDALGRKESGGS